MDPKDVREYLTGRLVLDLIEIVRLFGILQGLYARLERDRRP
jgi:hypothetical protein